MLAPACTTRGPWASSRPGSEAMRTARLPGVAALARRLRLPGLRPRWGGGEDPGDLPPAVHRVVSPARRRLLGAHQVRARWTTRARPAT